VNSKHPLFLMREKLFPMWTEAYRGGTAYINAALQRNNRELPSAYKSRVLKAIVINHYAAILQTYAQYMFRKPWKRESNLDDDWLDNIDLKEHSIDVFFKVQASILGADGYLGIGVDKPRVDNDDRPMTVAEVAALGIRPYFYTVRAADLQDWEVGGERTFTRLIQIVRRWRGSLGNRPNEEERGDPDKLTDKFWRLWTPEEVTLFDEKGQVVEQESNPHGEIPIFPCCFNDYEDDPVVGVGLGETLEPLLREHVNISSLYRAILDRETFTTWALQGDITNYSDTGGADDGNMKAFVYPEGMNAPTRMSPDATNAETFRNRLMDIEEAMWRVARLKPPKALEIGRPLSGVALKLSYDDTTAALKVPAQNIANAQMAAMKCACRMMDRDDGKESVICPEDFGIDDVTTEINELLDEMNKLVAANGAPALIEQVEKRIAELQFPELTDLAKQLTAQRAEMAVKRRAFSPAHNATGIDAAGGGGAPDQTQGKGAPVPKQDAATSV